MKNKKLYQIVALVLSASFIFTGCGNNSKPEKTVERNSESNSESNSEGKHVIKADDAIDVVENDSITYPKEDETQITIRQDGTVDATAQQPVPTTRPNPTPSSTPSRTPSNAPQKGENSSESSLIEDSPTVSDSTSSPSISPVPPEDISSEVSTSSCEHVWDVTTAYNPTCVEDGKVVYVCKLCDYEYVHVTPKTGYHVYVWRDDVAATPGKEGQRTQVCTMCGKRDKTEIVEAIPLGQETEWIYDDAEHRHKTMYDGTVLNEVFIKYTDTYKLWCYIDENATEQINIEVNKMLAQVDAWSPFVVDESYRESALRAAFKYAYDGPDGNCVKAYHANFGGLPNVSDQRKYITISDGMNQSNYIICLVRDGYQNSGNFMYGQYWRSYFGTYYASGYF